MLKKGLGSEIKFKNNREKVVLLLHGLRGVPKLLSELAEELYKAGYSIYNLRLPGHACEDDNQLLNVKLRDWECYVENIFLDLSDQFDEVFICGHSIGATLALQIQNKYKTVKKMVLYSPFLKFKQKYAFMFGIIGLFYRKIYRTGINTSIETDIGDKLTPFYPVPQLYEVYKLTKKTKKYINQIKGSILCFLSKKDKNLSYLEIEKILKGNKNFEIEILEKSGHTPTYDIEKDLVIKKTIDWFKE